VELGGRAGRASQVREESSPSTLSSSRSPLIAPRQGGMQCSTAATPCRRPRPAARPTAASSCACAPRPAVGGRVSRASSPHVMTNCSTPCTLAPPPPPPPPAAGQSAAAGPRTCRRARQRLARALRTTRARRQERARGGWRGQRGLAAAADLGRRPERGLAGVPEGQHLPPGAASARSLHPSSLRAPQGAVSV